MTYLLLLLLLLSCFSRVWLCATPEMAAHQAPPSLGFCRQEHWSGLPFPSPMHESEKWKRSLSFVSDPQRPHGLQPSGLLHPWDLPGKSTGVGAIAFSLGKQLKDTNGILTDIVRQIQPLEKKGRVRTVKNTIEASAKVSCELNIKH